MSTCTVVVTAAGGKCGATAVTSFKSKRTGEEFHECAEHESPVAPVIVKAAPQHPKTRTTAPYVLVAFGSIVGYAHSTSAAVQKRASKLGASIVPVSH